MARKFSKNDLEFLQETTKLLFAEILRGKMPYRCYVWPGPLRYNGGFKIERTRPSEWQIGGVVGRSDKVDIHFDASKFGEITLDVGVEPYEENTNLTEDRLAELERNNVPRVQVMREIRNTIANDLVVTEQLMVVTEGSGLKKPEYPKAHSAVKFIMVNGDPTSPEEFAAFCMQVLEAAGPCVDRWIVLNQTRWAIS
jgi:hypothetical protein